MDSRSLPSDRDVLFIKVHMRNARGRGELDDRQEIDEAYWAKAAADQAARQAGDETDDSKSS